ncbi:unnamed protein product [Sphagnum jensenii]|uniref:Uncharacterized protein n=1 Tax=Sphagnum jensenii TaxID=128206 RepID=A0ABP1BBV2_9BRYO
MDPYGDHIVTYKHGPHTIRHHDRMLYMQNIIANEAGLKSHFEKTSLIADRKDRPIDVYSQCPVPARAPAWIL